MPSAPTRGHPRRAPPPETRPRPPAPSPARRPPPPPHGHDRATLLPDGLPPHGARCARPCPGGHPRGRPGAWQRGRPVAAEEATASMAAAGRGAARAGRTSPFPIPRCRRSGARARRPRTSPPARSPASSRSPAPPSPSPSRPSQVSSLPLKAARHPAGRARRPSRLVRAPSLASSCSAAVRAAGRRRSRGRNDLQGPQRHGDGEGSDAARQQVQARRGPACESMSVPPSPFSLFFVFIYLRTSHALL
ncbi:hypothetical protein PVAP13_9NG766200 [Panicum virgatum]|uniref:Uncharacterized protein n=1 Tax=Panicum virgatum TaxID=38727 RepID=A0A8T0N4B2_PANVG|nr:hypothetical protein PVAP13_9NG766200 [Panicum virgatum]